MVNDVLNNAVSMGLQVVRTWAMIDVGSVSDSSRSNVDGMKESILIIKKKIFTFFLY